MTIQRVPPLPQAFPIVEPKTGVASSAFATWWQQMFGNTTAIDDDVTALADDVTALSATVALKADKTIQIIAGNGLTGGGTLAADRTINVGAGTGITSNANDVALANTAVTPATYGDATHVAQFTVDQQGRLTAASNVAISAGGGGGRTLIEEYIGDGTASTKTFSAIPGAGTYRSIELEIYGRVTAAVLSRPIQIIVNGLTTSIYDSQIHYANNATPGASQSLGAANITNVFELPGTSTSSGDVAGGTMVFLNHAGTVFNKLVYANARQVANTTSHSAFSVNSHGQVRLTAAITSLTATVATGGNFDTGTVIRLYGRA